MGSLQVIATTLPRPAKYRPTSVTSTILSRVIIYLPKGPFFENAWIDEVSMPSGIGVSSASSRTDIMSHLPSYWRAADTRMAVYVPCLLSTRSTQLTMFSHPLYCIDGLPIQLVHYSPLYYVSGLPIQC